MDNNAKSEQIVVFDLGGQEYGLYIDKIISIEKLMLVTRVPNSADCIKGVINLRGDIIPLIEIRDLLNIFEFTETENTRIIIFKVDDAPISVIVDSVIDIIYADENSIRTLSNLNDEVVYIDGIIKLDEREITLVNVDELVAFAQKGKSIQ